MAGDARPKESIGRVAARTRGLAAAVADGAVLPVRSDVVDLVYFAQAWNCLGELGEILDEEFPDGALSVRDETPLLTITRT